MQQTWDLNGNLIPLNLETGQIAWSVKGGGNRTMSGRSEQVNETLGIASTYACYNCCPNSVHDGWITPGNQTMSVGGLAGFEAVQQDINCYNQVMPSYPAGFVSWSSSNSSVASVSLVGQAEGLSAGDTLIEANWYADHWFAGLNELCEYTQVSLIRSAPVDVEPIVTIIGPSTAIDGELVNFSVYVSGTTPTGFQWSWSINAPNGAGNNPQVGFSDPSAPENTIRAHWFAYPNQPCSPNTPSATDPYYKSTYMIRVTVSHPGGETIAEHPFTVNAWWDPAGQVDPNVARVTGIPTRQPDSNGIWYVTGMGTLGRLTPVKQVFVPQASQFYMKTDAHEQEHEDHWLIGNLFGSIHDPIEFYNRIKDFTGTSEQDLINQMSAELTIYTNEQGEIVENLIPESERLAFLVSDPLTPQFAYQNCGRFP